jgi:hypothetical protein
VTSPRSPPARSPWPGFRLDSLIEIGASAPSSRSPTPSACPAPLSTATWTGTPSAAAGAFITEYGNGREQWTVDDLAATVTAAAGVFAVTNIDDIIVLTVLFLTSRSTGQPRPWQIVAGQYLGIGLLVA